MTVSELAVECSTIRIEAHGGMSYSQFRSGADT